MVNFHFAGAEYCCQWPGRYVKVGIFLKFECFCWISSTNCADLRQKVIVKICYHQQVPI